MSMCKFQELVPPNSESRSLVREHEAARSCAAYCVRALSAASLADSGEKHDLRPRSSRRCARGGRQKARRPANACGPPGIKSACLVVIAVDLLEESLGIKRADVAGDAGDHCKGDKGGQDGLHDHSPVKVADWLTGVADQSVVIAVNLLVELLGIHRAGTTGEAGDQ